MSKSRNEKALNDLKPLLMDLLKVVLALAIIGIFILAVWMVFNANENTRLARTEMLNSEKIDSTIDALISQQSVTLTVTGVSVALFAIFTTLFVGIREYTIRNQKELIEKLIRELNETYDTLIIINSFQGLRDHKLKKTKLNLMQRARKSESVLALHYQLDELYTYTSYDDQKPTIKEAYEAYKDVQDIYTNIREKLATGQAIVDYSSIEYLTLLKTAEAGYNLLANSLDALETAEVITPEDKQVIYARVTDCLKKARRIHGDPDGFISCREGLLLSLRVRHNWEKLSLSQEVELLSTAKGLLKKAVQACDSNNAVWNYNLGAICIQLFHRMCRKPPFKKCIALLDEAKEYCDLALEKDNKAYNAHINLASIILCRIAIYLNASPCTCLAEANYSIETDKEATIKSYCIDPGIKECKLAIQINPNNIGAYRKQIALSCVQTKFPSKEVLDVWEIFTDMIKLAQKAKRIEHGMKQNSKALKRDLDMLAAHISNNSRLNETLKSKLLANLKSIL